MDALTKAQEENAKLLDTLMQRQLYLHLLLDFRHRAHESIAEQESNAARETITAQTFCQMAGDDGQKGSLATYSVGSKVPTSSTGDDGRNGPSFDGSSCSDDNARLALV